MPATLQSYLFGIGVLLVVGYFAGFVVRARRLSRADPAHAEGYMRIAWAVFAWVAVAAVLLFIGHVLGLIALLPPVRSVLRQNPWTPYEIFLYVWNAMVIAAETWWLYGRRGVAYIVEHRALFGRFVSSSRDVNVIWALLLLSQVVGLAVRLT